MAPAEAWRLLDLHELRALPVVDEQGILVAIITLRDLIAAPDATPPRLAKQQFVSGLMSRSVQVTTPEQTVADLVPLFPDGGFHHLPVVDGARRVLGMVTQSDIIAALFQNKLDAGAKAS
ncbi:MAG: CBS domain-containing protein [Telluria sp.]